jgi:drug/metabolite transporter (DMT)-like permease
MPVPPANSPDIRRSGKRITLKTLLFALVAIVSEGLQPVISNSRPPDSPLFFRWMTVFWEFLCILPVYMWEQKKKREQKPATSPATIVVDRPRNHWKRLLVVGISFSISVYLMIVGYAMAGSVTGIIIVKTSPFFAMIFGWLYLGEQITLPEFGFTLILLFGVYTLATQGTFQMSVFAIAVIILLIVPFLWNLAHAITKPLLEKKVMTTPETIVVRMLLCTGILGAFCLITRGTQDFWEWTQPIYVWYMFLMGFVYACLHYTWYKLITEVNLSTATIIMTPSPVVTMVAAFFITQEVLQWYQIVGFVTAFIGILGIVLMGRKTQAKSHPAPVNLKRDKKLEE